MPEAKIDPATATVYDEDFEDVKTGTKSTDCVTRITPDPEGLKRWILRAFSDDNNTGKDYLEVVIRVHFQPATVQLARKFSKPP